MNLSGHGRSPRRRAGISARCSNRGPRRPRAHSRKGRMSALAIRASWDRLTAGIFSPAGDRAPGDRVALEREMVVESACRGASRHSMTNLPMMPLHTVRLLLTLHCVVAAGRRW